MSEGWRERGREGGREGVIDLVPQIPLPVSELNNEDHPVSVGISDALYIDTIRNQSKHLTSFISLPPSCIHLSPSIMSLTGRVRLVYEYHRVDLNASDDLSMSAYVITPLKSESDMF